MRIAVLRHWLRGLWAFGWPAIVGLPRPLLSTKPPQQADRRCSLKFSSNPGSGRQKELLIRIVAAEFPADLESGFRLIGQGKRSFLQRLGRTGQESVIGKILKAGSS